jgi:hypothetical protein
MLRTQTSVATPTSLPSAEANRRTVTIPNPWVSAEKPTAFARARQDMARKRVNRHNACI